MSSSTKVKRLFGTDGIRGTANQFPILPDLVLKVGQALFTFVLHFNPVVSLVEGLWKRLSFKEVISYSVVQVLGARVGVLITHYIFGLELFQVSEKNRGNLRFAVSEVIATFGLLLVIALSGKKNVYATPAAVALYITAAYWCTSSTSFANPAVTIARSFTNTFSGILWTGMPFFIVAQVIGALIAFVVSRSLSK